MAEAEGLFGWATNDLVYLDSLPDGRGLIARTITVSQMRRHAIFMVLGHRHVGDPAGSTRNDDSDAVLAKVLRRERAREIISHALGDVPDGLLGALERLAPANAPLVSPRAYERLYALFAFTEHRHKAEALQHVGQISEKMLRVLDALDPRWVHAETLKRIESVGEAKDFNLSVAFAQRVCTGATDEAIIGAIARLQPTSTLAGMMQRFVRRADRFPAQPIEQTDDLRPLASPRDLIETGRRQRCCLPTKLVDVLTGKVAFVEYRRDCIVEFRPLTGSAGWMVWEIHGPRNGPVPSDIAAAAAEACLKQGVPRVDDCGGGADVRSYRRFVRQPEQFHWWA